jgi:hypothetical protein
VPHLKDSEGVPSTPSAVFLGITPARFELVVVALVLALQRLGDLLGARKLVSFSQVAQTFDEGRRGVVGFGRRDQLLLAGRIIHVLQIPPYDGLIGFHGFLL